MKTNLIKSLFVTVCLAAGTIPSMASAVNSPVTEMTSTRPSNEQIMKRLEEIKAMDVKSMSSAERKQLKMEVKELKSVKKQNDVGGGVYISAGALIVIILILIIIL